MARRGEVLVARRRLGFASDGRAERFVVLQSDLLRDLDTVVVAPLDVDGPVYDGDPLVVRVTAREVAAKRPHVVLVHLLTATLLDRFEPGHVARLTGASMAKVEAAARVVLHLA